MNMMIKLVLVMLIAACSIIWLMCTYKKHEWGAHYAFIAASCAIVMGFDWFSTRIAIPSNLVKLESLMNPVFFALGIGTIYFLHRTEKISEF
jgi:hypothetical protein